MEQIKNIVYIILGAIFVFFLLWFFVTFALPILLVIALVLFLYIFLRSYVFSYKQNNSFNKRRKIGKKYEDIKEAEIIEEK